LDAVFDVELVENASHTRLQVCVDNSMKNGRRREKIHIGVAFGRYRRIPRLFRSNLGPSGYPCVLS